MNEDPIVAEVRRVREAMVREAGYDLERLCAMIVEEAAKIPHTGPRVRNAEELRRVVEQQAAMEATAVRETPPKYGAQ